MYTTQPHSPPPKPRRRWHKAKRVLEKGKESRKGSLKYVAWKALLYPGPMERLGVSIVCMFPEWARGFVYATKTPLLPYKPSSRFFQLSTEYSSSLQAGTAPSPPFPALSLQPSCWKDASDTGTPRAR